MKRLWGWLLLVTCCLSVQAQQYTGMSGLIHVPSAVMNAAGEARIGGHFLNREFVPDNFMVDGKKYDTWTHYLSITPFSWMEIGYTCTLLKGHKEGDKAGKAGFYHKDRYFSLKLQPLREGKWWPAVAIGTNDPYSGNGTKKWNEGNIETGGSQYFGNFYVAATKHIEIKKHRIGVHVAYRKWKRDFNNKWNGMAGGITYQPAFQPNLRLIAEYTRDNTNIGVDWKLWKHLLIQASLQEGKYFSGGLCFCINLL